MNNITQDLMNDISSKEIATTLLPKSNKVDSITFSRLLDDERVVASYKMYWLLGILEEVSIGNTEIEFNKIIARMIASAWYPTLQYKLNFGIFDNLKKPIKYVAVKYGFSSNYDEAKLIEFLCNIEDDELKKMMKDLTLNVPYRLLSPFFSEKLKGQKDSSKTKSITQLSLSDNKCLYKIIKGENDKIILNQGWDDYLNKNYRIIKSWIYYKLVCFLQKRNQNVPAIAFKLEAPKSRNLTGAAKLWKKIIALNDIKDIYTGKDFNEENYAVYGVLSIDHFIPWSFVLHDEMWNLVPTFKNINGSKNDKLLSYNNYINKFCDVQYTAVKYLSEEGKERELESYIDVLKIEDFQEYLMYKPKEAFCEKLKQCISPLYQIAENQGFEVMERTF